jgi:hypothetical protein
MCAASLVAPTGGEQMTAIPTSLSIALWLVGSMWLIAILAHAFDAPQEIVYVTFVIGLLAGVAEWIAFRRTKS